MTVGIHQLFIYCGIIPSAIKLSCQAINYQQLQGDLFTSVDVAQESLSVPQSVLAGKSGLTSVKLSNLKMEVLGLTTAAENGDSLTELIDEYRTLKDDYTLQGARKQMLDNLLAGTFIAQPIEQICSTQRLDAFLSMTKQLSDNYALLNADDEIIDQNQDSELDEHIQLELNRGQELLQKILEEQAVVKSSITTTQKQIVELNSADVISCKENAAPTNARNAAEMKIDDAKLRGLVNL